MIAPDGARFANGGGRIISTDGRSKVVPLTTPNGARANVALGVAVTAISFAAICFREAAPTHPLIGAAVRLGVVAILLLPFTVRGLWRGRTPRGWPMWLGGVCYALHFGSWVASLSHTSVLAATTLVTATPLFVACHGAITGRDPPQRWQWLGIAIAAVGSLWVAFGHGDPSGVGYAAHGSTALGAALALLGAAAMAGYLLVVRRAAVVAPYAFMGGSTLIGAVLLLLAARVIAVPVAVTSDRALFFLILAALVPHLIGHGLITWALRYIAPTRIAIATLAEPLGAALLAAFWLGEIPSASTVFGCAVVLIGVALGMRTGQLPDRRVQDR